MADLIEVASRNLASYVARYVPKGPDLDSASLAVRVLSDHIAEVARLREGFKLVPVDQPDVFNVRVNSEWGTFVLRKGQRQDAHGTAYWCELIAATSFGTVSHYWGNMGQPAQAFLPSIERGYALGKLWGMAAYETDVDATLAAVRHDLIEARRHGDIDKDEAREAWDSLPISIYSEDDLRDAARDSDYLMSALVDGDCLRKRTNPQADGFWAELWPEFIKQLTAAKEVGNGW